MGALSFDLPPLTGDTSWIDNPTGLEGLPTPVAPARPASSSSSTASQSATVNPRMGALGLNPDGTPAVGAVPSLTGQGSYISQITTWIQAHEEDFVFIIAGLILIAAAVFSFKGTQTVIETATKGAAKAAEVAA